MAKLRESMGVWGLVDRLGLGFTLGLAAKTLARQGMETRDEVAKGDDPEALAARLAEEFASSMSLGQMISLILANRQPPIQEGSYEDAREAYRKASKLLARKPPSGVTSTDVEYQGAGSQEPGGAFTFRRHLPAGLKPPFPTVMYIHGGGFVIGDLDTHHAFCQRLARTAYCQVLALRYPLAPENSVPSAMEHMLAAWQFLHGPTAQQELGVDTQHMGIGGDSAGGTFTALLCQRLAAEGGTLPAAQLLIYPATRLQADSPSKAQQDYGYGLPLTVDLMQWFVASAAHRDPEGFAKMVASAEGADLRKQPPALVVTARFDALAQDGPDYAQQLKNAGVKAEHREYDGMVHNFINLTQLPDARVAVEEFCSVWGELLESAPPGVRGVDIPVKAPVPPIATPQPEPKEEPPGPTEGEEAAPAEAAASEAAAQAKAEAPAPKPEPPKPEPKAEPSPEPATKAEPAPAPQPKPAEAKAEPAPEPAAKAEPAAEKPAAKPAAKKAPAASEGAKAASAPAKKAPAKKPAAKKAPAKKAPAKK